MRDENENTRDDGVMYTNQVLVTNIYWDKEEYYATKYRTRYDSNRRLPKQITLDLPEAIVTRENEENYMDVVETFVYGALFRRFNCIANLCQIYLPLEV